MKQQKGFTLIELVVVIVILGVLAAVALPRFMNATDDAHTSAVQGTGGALAAGVALVRSQWELNRVKGDDATPNVNVTGFGDGLVDVNTRGWPVGTNGDGTDTAPTQGQCVQLWGALLQGSAPSVAAAANSDYQAAVSADGCTYTYRLDGRTAGQRTIAYNVTTGAVTTTAD
ncbi:prepilin-type N-terminal cleavage/methylation domain-containing protein [Pseudomonas sp. GCM10022188]|uniref:prepilin-type N-terminal cleavage/methylation domain-containing protein n=1 Tax=Pseudomonas TaxID=286 RepID=UPI0029E7E38B|nr:prepilin-type N-terminal cleavage/methylation domain-containing protein [Pseudomonas oryzagri]